MPLVYRIMFADGDGPLVGADANRLGVRVGGNRPDISVEPDGTVYPGTGGLSVSPNMQRLPPHLIPKRLRPIFPGARGSNSKPTLIPWHMGEGEFAAGPVSDELELRPDPRYPDAHGLIEPARATSLPAYQAALAATRPLWVRHEWPVVAGEA